VTLIDPANDPGWQPFGATNQTVNNPAAGAGNGDLLSAWSDAAPTLPVHLNQEFAQAGLSPADPIGRWIIQSGVPALTSSKQIEPDLTEGSAAAKLLTMPGMLAQLKRLPIEKQSQIFSAMSVAQAGALTPAALTSLVQTGQVPHKQSFWGEIGDIAKTGIRDVMTGLSAPMEGALAGVRYTYNGMPRPLADVLTLGAPEVLERVGHVQIGGPGVHSLNDVTSQITLSQAMSGKSLGSGFFPGGPAHTAAVQAQQAAANINGHALTIGRAAADLVFEPGSRPYNMLSGAVDLGVALKGDPSAVALGELSDVVKGARLFADTPEGARIAAAHYLIDSANNSATVTALTNWARPGGQAVTAAPTATERLIGAEPTVAGAVQGAVRGGEPNLVRDIAAKLKVDPGSLQQLVGNQAFVKDDGTLLTHADIAGAVGRRYSGALEGWRAMVNKKDALTFLNTKMGVDLADKFAGMNFLDIWKASNGKIPADIVSDLDRANTPDEVRQILGANLGSVIRGVPDDAMPYAWGRSLANNRIVQQFDESRFGQAARRELSYLPRGYIDKNNLDTAVQQARRMMINARIPDAFQSDLLADMARSENNTQFEQAYTNIAGAVRDTLIQRGVEPNLARTLVDFSGGKGGLVGTLESQARWNDQVNNIPHISGVTVAAPPAPVAPTEPLPPGMAKVPQAPPDTHDVVPLAGPHLPAELLNRSLPVLDMRTINRNVGTWGKVWNHPVLGPWAKGATYLADSLTGAFKVFTLLKLALPVRFLADEQARMATAGLDSMFHHPMSYIAQVVGHDAKYDQLGNSWADILGDSTSAYRKAIGQSADWSTSIFNADVQLAKNYVTYQMDHPQFLKAWNDELSHLHIDPLGRETARAMMDPNYAPAGIEGLGGPDAAKEWFWSGAGQKYRNELADANLWGGTSNQLRNDRTFADQYIETVMDRIRIATGGGNQELLDAVAHGTPWGSQFNPALGKTVVAGRDRAWMKALGDYRADGIAPQQLRGLDINQVRAQATPFRNAVDKMFGALMDVPTQKLTRSPAFKQFYLKRFDEIRPYIDEGSIAATQADALAKDFALKETQKLLYYPGERASITDQLRNVAPFGEAWRNVLKTWARLGAENPAVFRRVEQGVVSAQESGFFYPDPQTGREVMTFVPAGIMKHLAGVPFPMTADVQGLNLIGSGLPGVGPAIQIPADALLPKGNVISDGLRGHLLPYGSPDYTGGFFETLFPGWLDKLRTSGWLLSHLPGNPNLPFLTPSANKRRVLGDLAKSVFTYHMSTGHYDLSQPGVLDQLQRQSQNEAQKLYLIRALGQFALPSAPRVTEVAKVPEQVAKTFPNGVDGTLVEQWLLGQDYRTMEKAYGSQDKATLAFVNKYGNNLIFATEPKSQVAPYAIPTTEEAALWRSANKGFATSFPNTYAYWAPSQGGFSYQTYLDQLKSGERVARSTADWARLAEARLGNAVFSQLRASAGASPNRAQRDILDALKTQMTGAYPGFNDQRLSIARATTDYTMQELHGAVNDPSVVNTPLSNAARQYMQLRDYALQVARAGTGNAGTTLSGKAQAGLRAQLYALGGQIATQTPQFQHMWETLFLPEVEPPEEAG